MVKISIIGNANSPTATFLDRIFIPPPFFPPFRTSSCVIILIDEHSHVRGNTRKNKPVRYTLIFVDMFTFYFFFVLVHLITATFLLNLYQFPFRFVLKSNAVDDDFEFQCRIFFHLDIRTFVLFLFNVSYTHVLEEEVKQRLEFYCLTSYSYVPPPFTQVIKVY